MNSLHSRGYKIVVLLVLLISNVLEGFAQKSASSASQYKPGMLLEGDVRIGKWQNAFKGDPNLAAVVVYQLSENPDFYYEFRRAGAHPSQIYYLFWNGDVVQMDFTPKGRRKGSLRYKQTESSRWWEEADFSFGSDPKFLRHRDPRVKDKK